ncbi:Iron permease [Mycena sanguinolenta]|uniref:Iron permease n=1 Tax=Mycena sanguinolenta TaxID=230812 RepID=A0A8H7CYV8_9AGAR|nr:Iron permease [Mycena sanguinolenta]
MSATASGLDLPADAPPKDLGAAQQAELEKPPRDLRFWLIFVSLCVCSFLTALEIGSITTALPTIIDVLHGTQFIWVGSAFALGSTALIPFAGGLAQIFGRRPILLGSLLLFGVGSAMCGAAKSMNVLIAGRSAYSRSRWRGHYFVDADHCSGFGLPARTWFLQWFDIYASYLTDLKDAVLTVSKEPMPLGSESDPLLEVAWQPSINGAGCFVSGIFLSIRTDCSNFSDLNIPICAVAAVLVIAFLRLRTPPGTLREKFARIDYSGNILVIAATTSTVIALTWGGIQFPWGSANVLVPLILGMVGLVGFFVYEGFYAKYPMVPFSVLSTLTALSGYIQTFLTSMIVAIINYYIQVYFQACYNVSPLASGVDGLALAIIPAPMGLIAGLIIQKRNSYRVPLAVGWILLLIGVGLLSSLDADTSRSQAIGYTVLCGAGFGILILGSYFPVLAPIKITQNAQALALFVFIRNFSLVWGVTVGGTILQNQLSSRLPADFVAQFPGGVEIAYSIIPVIPTLQDPLRTEVRNAFADALKVVWWTTTGLAGLGFFASLFMKHYTLHTVTDKEWGLESGEGEKTEVNP